MKLAIVFIVCVSIWLYFSNDPVVKLGPGVQVISVPYQSDVTGKKPFSFKGYSVTPLAKFDLSAKILSKENYTFGKEADLSPTDLALGWQNMSNQTVIDQLSISQSGRWYRWRSSDGYPIPRKEIETQSANMHIIPANSLVARVLEKTKKGQIVSLSGFLVRVDQSNWRWKSSLTRNDTGAGACELIYVESLDILKK